MTLRSATRAAGISRSQMFMALDLQAWSLLGEARELNTVLPRFLLCVICSQGCSRRKGGGTRGVPMQHDTRFQGPVEFCG